VKLSKRLNFQLSWNANWKMCCSLGMKPWHLNQLMHNQHYFILINRVLLQSVNIDNFPGKSRENSLTFFYSSWLKKIKRRCHSQREQRVLDGGHPIRMRLSNGQLFSQNGSDFPRRHQFDAQAVALCSQRWSVRGCNDLRIGLTPDKDFRL
jgi:hypothetical protein